VMAQADPRPEGDIRGDITHSLVVEGRLEFRRHETVTFSRIGQASEMDGKHGHVEGNGNDDQAESTSEEVLEPQPL
jgi:hypothetical protein